MKRFPLLIALGLVMIVGCDSVTSFDNSSSSDSFTVPDHSPASALSGDVIEGHYIVMLSKEPAARNAAAEIALETVTAALSRRPGAHIKRTYRHTLTGFAAELTDEQVSELRRDPRVLAVEADAYVYPAGDVTVQEYPTWGLDRIDQRELPLNRAYGYTATGQGVTAYVMDSGIRYSHDEFGGRASFGIDLIEGEEIGGEDCAGHGTHVAGTIGGETYGVAKDVQLVSVRVLGCNNRGTWSGIIAGIDWVTENAVHPAIVNASLTGIAWSELTAVDVAVGNSIASGVHYIVAAGNEGHDACNNLPARSPGALTVGASTASDQKSVFSNYGDCVDLYAPGTSITSAMHSSDQDTAIRSGTSMASPHVAGVVALYLETNPAATPAEIFESVITNATSEVITDIPYGANLLLHSLFEEVEITPPPPPVIILTTEGSRQRGEQIVDLTWNSTSVDARIIWNGEFLTNHPNTGTFRHHTGQSGPHGTHRHQICEAYSDICSNEVTTVIGNGGDDGGTDPPPGDDLTASFSYSCGNSPTCQFTDTSTGDVVEWNWTSTSGHSSGDASPSFTFGGAGDHTVTLSVTDADNLTDSASATINCRDHPRHGLRCS
jgi:PKD repeat protein